MISNSLQALLRAVEIAGNPSSLARACGTKQGNVWYWINKSQRVSAPWVLAVERATGVSRHELRPDIYPPPPAGMSSPPAAAPDRESAA